MARQILIVEDDPSVLKAITRNLRLMGFEVSHAMTATEGIAKLDSHKIVVLDLNLPDASGATVLRKIRDENRAVRTAIWTAMPELATVGELAALKPDAVFHKVDVEKLLAWINSAEAA